MFIKCLDTKGKRTYIKPDHIVRFYGDNIAHYGDLPDCNGTVMVVEEPDGEEIYSFLLFADVSPDALADLLNKESQKNEKCS